MRAKKIVPRLADLPEGLTVDEAALVLRISVQLVYQLIQEGRLVALKLGRRITIPKAVVARMLMVEGADGVAAVAEGLAPLTQPVAAAHGIRRRRVDLLPLLVEAE